MTDKSDSRSGLEARAELLGIQFRPNWKDETLQNKIAEAEANAAGEQQSPQGGTPQISPQQAGDGSTPADNTKAIEASTEAGADNGRDPQAGGPVPPADTPHAEKLYLVIDALRRDGELYGNGDHVSLTRDEYETLKSAGVVIDATED